MSNTIDTLNKFGKETVSFAKRNLAKKGFGGQKKNRKKDASGKLSRSLGFNIDKTNTGFVIDFTSKVNYARFVEEGRKKGKMPPAGVISKWFIQKGLKGSRDAQGRFVKRKSAIFAIRKHIKENNIKPVPFFSEAMDEAYDKNKEAIADAIALDFEDLIFNNFQKNGSNS